MKKKPKLTIKQRKFLKEYVRTGNGTKAALKAYDTTDEKTAESIASENLSKPVVKAALLRAQRKAGITDEYLARKLKEKLEARETKFFQHEGEVVDKRVVVAHDVQVRALEIAHKLRGDYAPGLDDNSILMVMSIDTLKSSLRDYDKNGNKTNKKN